MDRRIVSLKYPSWRSIQAELSNSIYIMDFVALNCNLGLALELALEYATQSENLREKAKSLYVESFENIYAKYKEQLPEMIMTGRAITAKEYPVKDNRQYFEAIIYDPTMTQGKDSKGENGRSNGKIKFAKIEAMEPKNLKNNRQNNKKDNKRKAAHKLSDKPRKARPKPQKIT